MENRLFTYGKPAQGDTFTDRIEEQKRLASNLKYGINTFLISPRRWGKTSLVMKVLETIKSKDLMVVMTDVYRCKNQQEFCECVASAVMQQTLGKTEELSKQVRGFFSRISLNINLSTEPMNPISFNLSSTNDPLDLQELLSIPQKIAKKKKCNVVVCIDEFQQVGDFEDSLSFQKLLRTEWQHQENVTYCLFGSKKHMMEKLFNDESKPFFKFGDTLYLQRIPLNYWTSYITNKFNKEGKTISDDLCKKICEKVGFNSYYVQQLSWILFLYTDKNATEDNLELAIDDLIMQNAGLFEAKTDKLTAYQMHYLYAVADGINTNLSSSHIISKYKLGSSANVAIIKSSLLDKDIIVETNGQIELSDPVMGLWLRR